MQKLILTLNDWLPKIAVFVFRLLMIPFALALILLGVSVIVQYWRLGQ